MNQQLPARSEVEKSMTWDLTDIYAGREAWEKEVEDAVKTADELAACSGTICRDAAAMLAFLQKYEALELKTDRFYGYAAMLHDQDTADALGQELNQKAQSVMVQIAEKTAFIEPEILAFPGEELKKYFEQEPGLLRYQVMLAEIRRREAHSLSGEMEQLLASAGEMAMTPSNAFGMLESADLKFPSVKDSSGEEIQLSNGRFVPLQMSGDRALRKTVFEAYYERYKEFRNTWAALYDGQVRQQIFFAKARKYGSTFEAAVDGNNVQPAVCDSLISCVHANLDKMHRYVSLRKKMLGVEELHMYDVYASMVKDYEIKVSYEEAKELSLKALAPLGEDYLDIVRKAYEERWIDVLENEGKRGGAYSSGVYDVHPYMLLNYNGTLDDVFTLVHEMGHSMHTWYSTHSQNILDARYKIFVAEVASTTNEVLLLEYLLAHAGDKQEKAYLLNHYLENFKSTVYRQTMFEEFERKTNAMAEAGTPLTAQALSDVYYELNRQYFGDDMVSDPLIAYEWCRIPHFYYNFYVYQYATSFCAAVAIAHRILAEGAPMVEQYKKFLSGGCTDDPVSLLKLAGVDLSTDRPVQEALDVFGSVIEEMEALSEDL